MSSIPVKESAPSKAGETTAERFQRLAALWHRDTDYLSSMAEANNHVAYQEIISMGPQVMPLLLQDLEKTHSHWFGALRAITGANPVPPTAAGNVPLMVEAWLRWAKDNGYRW
jgi:hypothetical protein